MESLTRLIDSAIASKDDSGLNQIFSPSGGFGSLGQGEQRALCGYFIKKAVLTANYLPAAFATQMNLFLQCLNNLPTVVEQAADSNLRFLLFDYLVEQQDYTGGARILAGMRLETDPTSVYYKSAADTCDVYVKIAECFLEEDETVEADAAVTKAGQVVEQIPANPDTFGLLLRYKSTYARVLDANRKFLQAASRYHDLSQTASDQVNEDDLLQMLGRAATCAILAPSGSQKHRILGLLIKDARLEQLSALPQYSTHANLVRQMYVAQIIKPDESIKILEASLADHQKAIRADGLTILQRSLVEHNMIACSRLYKSIYLEELSKLLLVPAERIATRMIMDKSLVGEIDQVDGLLYFGSPQENEWNRGIISFCTELNNLTDAIKQF